ncbi:unnamed protein product [Gadus morhua 'NCC']
MTQEPRALTTSCWAEPASYTQGNRTLVLARTPKHPEDSTPLHPLASPLTTPSPPPYLPLPPLTDWPRSALAGYTVTDAGQTLVVPDELSWPRHQQSTPPLLLPSSSTPPPPLLHPCRATAQNNVNLGPPPSPPLHCGGPALHHQSSSADSLQLSMGAPFIVSLFSRRSETSSQQTASSSSRLTSAPHSPGDTHCAPKRVYPHTP